MCSHLCPTVEELFHRQVNIELTRCSWQITYEHEWTSRPQGTKIRIQYVGQNSTICSLHVYCTWHLGSVASIGAYKCHVVKCLNSAFNYHSGVVHSSQGLEYKALYMNAIHNFQRKFFFKLIAIFYVTIPTRSFHYSIKLWITTVWYGRIMLQLGISE